MASVAPTSDGFSSGHRNQQVGAQSRVGEVERAELRELAGGAHARDVIQVEIHKNVFDRGTVLKYPAASARSACCDGAPALGDAHTGSAHPSQGFEGGMHQQGMRVDAAIRFELDQIGLDHDVGGRAPPADALPTYGEPSHRCADRKPVRAQSRPSTERWGLSLPQPLSSAVPAVAASHWRLVTSREELTDGSVCPTQAAQPQPNVGRTPPSAPDPWSGSLCVRAGRPGGRPRARGPAPQKHRRPDAPGFRWGVIPYFGARRFRLPTRCSTAFECSYMVKPGRSPVLSPPPRPARPRDVSGSVRFSTATGWQ